MNEREVMTLSFNRTAILGATGPTGKFLAEELLRRKLDLRVVSRSEVSLAQAFGEAPVKRLNKVEADVLDGDGAARAVEGCDLVFDCIGLPMEAIGDHPKTARNIARSVERNGARCVQVSSYWPYIPLRDTMVNEDHPRQGGAFPVRMRREAEDILQGSGAAIVELPDFYGLHVHTSILQQTLQAAISDKTVNWMGSLDTAREYIYVPDAMNATAELAFHEQAYGERWIVSGVGPVTMRRVQEIVERHLHRHVKVRTAGLWTLRLVSLFNRQLRSVMPLAPTYVKPVCFDGTKLRKLLGKVPATPYEEAIPQTLDWLSSR
jgi:nucleoside-diphosphate-sugar epimerase